MMCNGFRDFLRQQCINSVFYHRNAVWGSQDSIRITYLWPEGGSQTLAPRWECQRRGGGNGGRGSQRNSRAGGRIRQRSSPPGWGGNRSAFVFQYGVQAVCYECLWCALETGFALCCRFRFGHPEGTASYYVIN